MYTPFRKSVSLLQKLLSMRTALFSAPAKQQNLPPRNAEKLDLELDFVNALLPTKTRLTHPHILFSPMHYEPNYAYPLLVWLHGTGSDERQLMKIMPQVSMRNYVAVAPRGLPIEQPTSAPVLDFSVSAILQRPKEKYDWTLSDGIASGDDSTGIEQRIFDCITIAQERCNIAADRIFIAGFGTGGTAALRLAMLYPEYFMGAAAFGGDIPTGNCLFPNWQCPSWQMTKVPSVLLGIDEAVEENVCRMMELFYTAGLSADIRKYPDTEQLTSEMLQDLNRWMMQIVCQPQLKAAV